jgi:orotate phosphoribosyltransferase
VEYLRQQLLSNSHEGLFELTSKIATDWYFDVRPLLLDSHAGAAISGLFYSKLLPHIKVIAGTGLSGSLIVASMLSFSCKSLKGLIVRDKKRRHGLQKIIEGDPLISNCEVAFVDDLISTGSSFRHAREALEIQRGCRVAQAIFLIDRTIDLPDFGIPVTCFFKADNAGELYTHRGDL